MGRPTAWLPFAGELMLPRVVRLLSQAVDPVIVVAAPDQEVPPLPPRKAYVPSLVLMKKNKRRLMVYGLVIRSCWSCCRMTRSSGQATRQRPIRMNHHGAVAIHQSPAFAIP